MSMNEWIKEAPEGVKCCGAMCKKDITPKTPCVKRSDGSFGCYSCSIKLPSVWAGYYPVDWDSPVDLNNLPSKLEAAKGLGCVCGCGNVFLTIDWSPKWKDCGCNTNCGIEPRWKDGIVPALRAVLYTKDGLVANSICPNCGILYTYRPNTSYWCEAGGDCGPVGPDGYELVALGTPVTPGKPKIINLISFSYAYGVPKADKVYDLRSMVRNPWRDAKLRKLNGLDPSVRNFIERCRGAKKVTAIAAMAGKIGSVFAFGCMGGKHRSVAVVEMVAEHYRSRDWIVEVEHRDINTPRATKPKKEKNGP